MTSTTISRKLWAMLHGPQVYMKYSLTPPKYPSNGMESFGDTMLSGLRGVINLCVTVSPIILLIAYNRQLLNTGNVVALTKGVLTWYSVAMCIRMMGRIRNPEYSTFLDVLHRATDQPMTDARLIAELADYDYQMFAAPVAFKARKLERRMITPTGDEAAPDTGPILNPIRHAFAYIFVHSFGKRIAYPGRLSLFNLIVQAFTIEQRHKLIIQHEGRRALLLTSDDNRIDTMFVDRRNKNETGNTLVVSCEGNAGMYETGIMATPLTAGYSVLGWNHPGFGESSGDALPEQIANAMDAVMQYATDVLGFREEDVVIFAWSIGGFPGTWAAANYPNIRGLILDATFDDLLPLAETRMPKAFGSLVKYAVRTFINLPVARQLELYPGPVLIIRRAQDEMLTTNDTGSDDERRASNRANDLLKSLLRSRHPGLIDGFEVYVDEWLAADVLERLSMTAVSISNMTDIREQSDTLTEHQRAQLIYALCAHYFVDYDSTHNTPLMPMVFTIPTAL